MNSIIQEIVENYINSKEKNGEMLVKINETITNNPSVTETILTIILEKIRFGDEQHAILNCFHLLDFCVENSIPLFLVSLYGHLNVIFECLSNLEADESKNKVTEKIKESLQCWEKKMVSAVGPSYVSKLKERQLYLSPEEKKKLRKKRRNDQKLEKLRKELNVVESNASLLLSIVKASNTVEEMKNETTFQLLVNCREMQKRMIQLIETDVIKDESTFIFMLKVNDILSQSIIEFDTFYKTGKKKNNEEKEEEKKKEGEFKKDGFGIPMFGMDEIDKNDEKVISFDQKKKESKKERKEEEMENNEDNLLQMIAERDEDEDENDLKQQEKKQKKKLTKEDFFSLN